MRKFLLSIAILICGVSWGQTSLSFYHLGNTTYQNTFFNPAWMPDGKVFIGLPVISGVHFHANTKLSYSDVIVKQGDETLVDVKGGISRLQNNNMMSVHAGVSLFHLGYRLPNGTAVSLFANERFEHDFLYSKTVMELAWLGTGNKLGEELNLDFGISTVHFREIGIGVAHQFNKRMVMGARFKYLQGMYNYSTPGNMKTTLTIDPATYAWNFQAENVVFRSSGQNIYDGNSGDLSSHLKSPGNGGIGLDVGAHYRLSNALSIAFAVNDIGFINWRTDVEGRVLENTSFSYSGINMRNANDILRSVQDSLLDNFQTRAFTDASYKTWLPARAYASGIYTIGGSTDLIGTVGARYIQGEMKMLYGIGARQQYRSMTFTGNVTKLPQQFLNLGAAFAVKGGPVQYYVAMDQLLSINVPKARSVDVRTGVNLIFGKSKDRYGRPIGSAASTGASTSSFLGTRVKARRVDGVYSVIDKQKPRKVPKSGKGPDPVPRRPMEVQSDPVPADAGKQPKITGSKAPKFDSRKTKTKTSTKPKFDKKQPKIRSAKPPQNKGGGTKVRSAAPPKHSTQKSNRGRR
jgi:hypothetical protein